MRAETVNVDGRAVYVWRGGAGRPLLLLQGGMADAELHWSSVWHLLAETFEVVAPDWPGFGGSEAIAAPTWPSMLGWLNAFVEQQAGGRADIVGNSFGGTVSRLFAAAYPQRVGRLVILNGGGLVGEPTASALRGLPDDPAVMAQLGQASFSRDVLSRMVADDRLLTEDFLAACQANPIILTILRDSLKGPQPASLTPAAPTLVLWGEADRHTPPESGRAVADAIPGARFATISRAGHLPQLENPVAVVTALVDFLKET